MITIFTIPKAFHNQIGTIQTNAIRSWIHLGPACEVILLGKEDGTAEIATELGIRHIADIECNEWGTPLISSAFNIAQEASSNPIMCYANADIIFLSDLLQAITQVQMDSFLIIGRRRDIVLDELLDFKSQNWEDDLASYVQKKGSLHRPSGLDYFIFPRGLWKDIPPFIVGRAGWDNWMVLRARLLGIPVIDATGFITAVHQNHDYSHLPKGKQTMRAGPEATRNLELLGGKCNSRDVLDATYVLNSGGLNNATNRRYFIWRIVRLPEMYPHLIPLVQIVLVLRYMILLFLNIRSKTGALN